MKRSYPYPIATSSDSVEYMVGVSAGFLMQFDDSRAVFVGSTPAQGEIIYWNGSAWALLAPGTAGYVLKTGGTGANPSWGRYAGGDYLTSGTFTTQTAVGFPLTSYTGYRGFRFVFTRVVLTSGTADFFIRTSTDGGANYDSGAGEYSYSAPYFHTAADFSHSVADTCIRFDGWLADSGYFELDISVWNPSVANAEGTLFKGDFSFANSAGATQYTGLVSGTREANADVDAISINCDADTMSGNYAIYGLA
jgi:hypothetical protein